MLLRKEEFVSDSEARKVLFEQIALLGFDDLYEVYRICYLKLHPSEVMPPKPSRLDTVLPIVSIGIGAFGEFLRLREERNRRTLPR